MRFLVVFEKGEDSVGAYVPDLPGCVAVGDTVEEAEELIRGAETIPEPSSFKEVEVA